MKMMHILAACDQIKDQITKRHDYGVKKIVKELMSNQQHPTRKNLERKIMEDRYGTAATGHNHVENDEVTTIIEVTILYETSNQYLEQRRHDRINKYEKILLEDGLLQVECNKERIVPIVIGALGNFTDSTNKDLYHLKLQKQHDVLQMIVATGFVNIINNHLRRED